MRTLFLLLLILPLSGCDFWFDSFDKKSDVSLFISSTPRTSLDIVELTINKIELQHSAGQWHTLTLNHELKERNLQTITSENPLLIASGSALPKGEYIKVRLYFDTPAGTTNTRQTNGQFEVFASNDITLEIEPRLHLVEGEKSELLLTIDFQHGLAYYEDDYDWYYRLEPQSLRAMPRDTQYFYGSISENTWKNLGCDTPEFTENNERLGSYVYLYRDKDQDLNKLSDLIINNTDAPVATALAIVTNTDTQQSKYRFAPTPSGRYILALTCHGDDDHPNVHNVDVVISQGEKVQLKAKNNYRLDF